MKDYYDNMKYEKQVYDIARFILKSTKYLSSRQLEKQLSVACSKNEYVYQRYLEIRAKEWKTLLDTMEREFSIAF